MMDKPVNTSSVPQRSPFRYPGGKTWLVPRIRQWLKSLPARPAGFIEPFAGGAIASLTVAFEDLAHHVIMIELDEDVASVFYVTEQNVRSILTCRPVQLEDRAFVTIVRNRMQRGGIMASGATIMKQGENGNGLKSRWYVETLCRRISAIAAIRDKISIRNKDGLIYMARFSDWKEIAWFIDPPYVKAGRRLYTHSEIDHRQLFQQAQGLRGPFLMTYDDNEFVRNLASEFKFDTRLVPMRNTHNAVKSELLIGRNLDWV